MAIPASASAEPRIDAVVKQAPDLAQGALSRVPEQGRKLLALRSYLRSSKSIEARWSWTQEQIEAYGKSDQYATAMAAVAAVSKAFEVKNPGYTLQVNTEIRSLDEQIEKWNSNGSVKSAAAELDTAGMKWLADNPKASAEGFKAFLQDWKPGTSVSIAAPGLTAHGRGLAFDFQVAKDGTVVAGADTGAIASSWEAGGWNAKLQEAVRLSTLPFEGPLTDPNEPWHYDYSPKDVFKPPAERPAEIEAATAQIEATNDATKQPIPEQKPAESVVVLPQVPEPSNSEAEPQPPAIAPIPAARPATAEQDKQAIKPAAKKRQVKKRKANRKRFRQAKAPSLLCRAGLARCR